MIMAAPRYVCTPTACTGFDLVVDLNSEPPTHLLCIRARGQNTTNTMTFPAENGSTLLRPQLKCKLGPVPLRFRERTFDNGEGEIHGQRFERGLFRRTASQLVPVARRTHTHTPCVRPLVTWHSDL